MLAFIAAASAFTVFFVILVCFGCGIVGRAATAVFLAVVVTFVLLVMLLAVTILLLIAVLFAGSRARGRSGFLRAVLRRRRGRRRLVMVTVFVLFLRFALLVAITIIDFVFILFYIRSRQFIFLVFYISLIFVVGLVVWYSSLILFRLYLRLGLVEVQVKVDFFVFQYCILLFLEGAAFRGEWIGTA